MDFDSAISSLEEKCFALRKKALSIGQEMGMYQTETLQVVMNEKGSAVVAKKFIPKGSFVCQYEGELVSASEGKRRSEEIDTCFLYFFQLNRTKYCLDATPEANSIGRNINHSRKYPNLKPVAHLIEGKPAVAFYAKEDILPFTEILYDYGEHDPKLIAKDPWLKFWWQEFVVGQVTCGIGHFDAETFSWKEVRFQIFFSRFAFSFEVGKGGFTFCATKDITCILLQHIMHAEYSKFIAAFVVFTEENFPSLSMMVCEHFLEMQLVPNLRQFMFYSWEGENSQRMDSAIQE